MARIKFINIGIRKWIVIRLEAAMNLLMEIVDPFDDVNYTFDNMEGVDVVGVRSKKLSWDRSLFKEISDITGLQLEVVKPDESGYTCLFLGSISE